MITDYCVLGFSILFFFHGFRKGLLSILASPLSLLLGLIISWVYYNKTHNFLISIVLSIIAPIIIHIALRLILKFIKPSEDKIQFSLGRLLAGCVSLAWNGAWLILTIIIIMLLPHNLPWLASIQNDISHSKSYSIMTSLSGNGLPSQIRDINKISKIINDPAMMEKFKDSKEMKEIVEQKDVKLLFNDEKSRQQIEKKDYVGLLQNPHMQAILSNPELLKKFIKLQEKITE